ncbi:MAG: metallophosphoesterase, partial [Clostridia bacterium]|nr:metallophosphoesterase [Clostridia bacterium]
MDKMEDRCFKYMRYVIEQANPDLILLTGDLVYGEFDDSGYCLEQLISFMDSFKKPWAPVIGNHEGESKKGVDWQCQQLEQSEYCLFKQRRFMGNGNYSVGLVKGGQLVRAFFMMDSNGYSNMSEETVYNKHSISTAGFAEDQIAWYSDAIDLIKEKSPKTKLSFAWHIPSQVFTTALSTKYGHDEGDVRYINIDELDSQTDFGLINSKIGGVWDKNMSVWNGLKEKGVDSIFVGHVHAISASVVYDGIRLQFGQKSSTYDAVNYVNDSGEVVYSYSEAGKPIVGGNVFYVSGESGEIVSPSILLYEE